MTPLSYLISVTYTENQDEVMLAILNKAGLGRSEYCTSDSSGSRALWIIPKGKKSRHEVITQLEAVPAIHHVAVVALSKPFKETQLAEIRQVFSGVGLDAKNVSDNELSMFINDKIERKYLYYLDFDGKKTRRDPYQISIKPLQEHPDFSPDWIEEVVQTEEEELDRDLTMDDFETVSGSFDLEIDMEDEIEALTPPPPSDNKQQQTGE